MQTIKKGASGKDVEELQRLLGVCGCRTVAEFVSQMQVNEGKQLDLFVHFLQGNKWDVYLRKLDWKEFARHYNGSGYAQNQYDKKLEKAYAKYK